MQCLTLTIDSSKNLSSPSAQDWGPTEELSENIGNRRNSRLAEKDYLKIESGKALASYKEARLWLDNRLQYSVSVTSAEEILPDNTYYNSH